MFQFARRSESTAGILNYRPCRRQLLMAGACCLALALLPGCGGGPPGPKTIPVYGVVTYNSKPVSSGEITFAPVDAKGQPTLATIGSDGSFTAKFSEAKPGLVAGDYKLVITSYKVPLAQIPPPQLAKMGDTNLAVPKKYTDLKTTPLTLSVTEKDGSKKLDLKLED